MCVLSPQVYAQWNGKEQVCQSGVCCVCVCVWLLVISLKLTQHNASAVTVERVQVNYGLLLNIFQYQIINRQRYVHRIVSLKMKLEITKKKTQILKYEIFYYLRGEK